MKTKSYDSRAMKTYSESVRRMTYNNNTPKNNTNDHFNYQTTGNKYDYADCRRITEEDKKDFKEKDVKFKKNFKPSN